MDADAQLASPANDNEALRTVGAAEVYPLLCAELLMTAPFQISNSLQNALDTFGAASPQYQAVLEILKDFLEEIEKKQSGPHGQDVVDPDMLTAAMGFLAI